jgi:biotin operon repressor
VSSVDQDLFGFIREQLGSVWGLELLLLMRRQGDRHWSPQELVGELRASSTLVADNLASLEKAGLVVEGDDGRYVFSPASPLLSSLCDQLDTAYRERPVTVINAIVSPPDKLKALADAFRIKGGGK